MAFQSCASPLCKVTFFVLFSVCAAGEGQYKGFRKLIRVKDGSQRAVLEEQWFTQKLDHFNGADTRVWKQVSLSMLM